MTPLAANVPPDSRAALAAGHRFLANWLRDVEAKWTAHSNRRIDGQPRMSLGQRLDYLRNLSAQSSDAAFKVAYTKAGTRLSAVALEDDRSIIDHKAYWAPARSMEEAGYLVAIINSGNVLSTISAEQSHGQRDPRDFDKLVWTLPIPEYDAADALHRELAAAAARAQLVAERVALPDTHFTARRRAIRAALAADGVAAEIEALVATLIP